MGFLGGSDTKQPAWNAGDLGSIAGSEKSPAEGNGYPLQYSCLENSMERGTWHAIVHGVAKSCKRPSDWAHTHSIENHNSCTKIQSHQQDTNLPSPAFVSSCLFDDSHSNRCEMISHCCFNLHFPTDSWCWASVYVSVGLSCIFLAEMFIQVLQSFFNWVIWDFFAIELPEFLL